MYEYCFHFLVKRKKKNPQKFTCDRPNVQTDKVVAMIL